MRPGVSKEDIHRTCNELAGQGKKVTIDAVRNIIGGSDSTLAPIIRLWKSTHPGNSTLESQIPAFLVQATKEVYDRACSLANVRVLALEKVLTEAKTQAQMKQVDAERAIKAISQRETWLSDQNAVLNKQLEALQAESASQRAKVTSLEMELILKSDRLASKQAAFDELSGELKQARRQQEHFENAHKEKVQEDLREIRYLQDTTVDQAASLRAAEANVTELRAMLAHANHSNDGLRTELSKANSTILQMSQELIHARGEFKK